MFAISSRITCIYDTRASYMVQTSGIVNAFVNHSSMLNSRKSFAASCDPFLEYIYGSRFERFKRTATKFRYMICFVWLIWKALLQRGLFLIGSCQRVLGKLTRDTSLIHIYDGCRVSQKYDMDLKCTTNMLDDGYCFVEHEKGFVFGITIHVDSGVAIE